MNQISAPRPESCTFCGGYTNPQIRRIPQGEKIVTEAHYVCPRCTQRFKIGILGTEDVKHE